MLTSRASQNYQEKIRKLKRQIIRDIESMVCQKSDNLSETHSTWQLDLCELLPEEIVSFTMDDGDLAAIDVVLELIVFQDNSLTFFVRNSDDEVSDCEVIYNLDMTDIELLEIETLVFILTSLETI